MLYERLIVECMKILFTTESYHPIIDGGAIAQHRIVHELVKRGHDVRVVAPGFHFKNYKEDDNGSIIYRPRGIKLPFYMGGKYNFCPYPYSYVKKVINEFKPDITDVNSPYPNSLSALNIGRKKNIPVVGSIHILPENILSPLTNSRFYPTIRKYTWKYLIYFYNKVDLATVPTETGANIYKDHGLKTNVTPISNGVDTSVFYPGRDGEYLRKKIGVPKENVVLYTGRINPEKNLDVLIKAIPLVVKNTDAHFLFCGSGGAYRDSIIQMTKDLGVFDKTTFIQFLEWEDYKNIYSLGDVFVMPGEAELQSIVTLEAIASGLPAVVVNRGAVHELVNNNNGYVFESGNSEQLAEHIIKILSDKKLQKNMSKKSLELVKKHSMETVGERYEKVYKKLTDSY